MDTLTNEAKTCTHVFLAGKRKGMICGTFLRNKDNGRTLCSTHFKNKNRRMKRAAEKEAKIKEIKESVEQLAKLDNNNPSEITENIQTQKINTRGNEDIGETEDKKSKDLKTGGFEVSKFDLKVSPLKGGNSLVIYGSSRSGKTTQLMKIIKKHYNSKKLLTILMSPSIQAKIYKKLPKTTIKIPEFQEELVTAIWKINRKTENNYPTVFIMDDCLVKNSNVLLNMLLVMRNSLISSVLLLQDCRLLSRAGRNNINFFIFRSFRNLECIEDLIRVYLNGHEPFFSLPTMRDKIMKYKEITKDHFIFLDNLEDKIFIVKDPK